jgi:hypothetical protein
MIGKCVFDVDGSTCGYTGRPFFEAMIDFHEKNAVILNKINILKFIY